jgi:hypothetical protein
MILFILLFILLCHIIVHRLAMQASRRDFSAQGSRNGSLSILNWLNFKAFFVPFMDQKRNFTILKVET